MHDPSLPDPHLPLPPFEMVTEWSHIKFDRPVPLVPRTMLRPGDIVQSSGGYRLLLTEVRITRHPITLEFNRSVYIAGHVHAQPENQLRSEIFDGPIPVLSFAGEPT
jgi:hypothetical protein